METRLTYQEFRQSIKDRYEHYCYNDEIQYKEYLNSDQPAGEFIEDLCLGDLELHEWAE